MFGKKKNNKKSTDIRRRATVRDWVATSSVAVPIYIYIICSPVSAERLLFHIPRKHVLTGACGPLFQTGPRTVYYYFFFFSFSPNRLSDPLYIMYIILYNNINNDCPTEKHDGGRKEGRKKHAKKDNRVYIIK